MDEKTGKGGDRKESLLQHHRVERAGMETSCGTVSAMVSHWFHDIWTRKTLEKRVPITKWLPLYTWSMFINDALAGLTVGLTAIPQGIAYAVVAGLEPQYGLYSGFMGCFVYLILGSAKDITIGPTAIMALMTQKPVADHGADFAVLLCFLSGCIISLFGILHLGFLVNFISMPVTVGFTTAAAITIACSQIKGLLGIQGKSNEFLETWISLSEHIKETRYQDVCLGLITILILTVLKVLNDYNNKHYSNPSQLSTGIKTWKAIVRLLSLARNALVVVLGTLVAYLFYINDSVPFQLTGTITGGMPPFQPPPFSTVTKDNITMSFTEMTAELGPGIISVPLIAILESIAIAKAFSKGKTLDATQEMIALGASNIVGSFVRSMPVTGSFTRTAVNNASGVKTPLGGIFTGALVISALALTSTFYFIPKATLAAVIISAMFYMIDYQEIALTWKTKKIDIIPLIATILGCLFLGLDYGMLVGICVNVLFILYHAARPVVTKEETKISEKDILIVRPEQSLNYPSAEYVRESIMKSCMKKDKEAVIVIDGRNLHSIDSTVAKNLKTLTQDLSTRKQDIVFWNWQTASVETCLGLDKQLEKYFRNDETMEQLLLRREDRS